MDRPTPAREEDHRPSGGTAARDSAQTEGGPAPGDGSFERLVEAFLARRRSGSLVTPEDFARENPQHARRIQEIFPVLLAMENLRHAAGDAGQAMALQADGSWVLGGFRILKKIGEGGMGVVYEALEERLCRRVALKVLSPVLLSSRELRERFQREARAAARLHHTNIVPVFGAGEDRGVLYYAMQYIEGRTLERLVKDWSGCAAVPEGAAREIRRDWPRIARIGRELASALAYAHSQGILHRDMKPSNVLLDADGTAWITDFGLAKLPDSHDLTRPGVLLGTLRYLPPEQFRGVSDERSDIYGLGLILYELATLRPAFDAASQNALLLAVSREAPPPPRSIDSTIPRDLETILVKATAREPERRYPSASELAADLQRFLEGRPVLARRMGAALRLWRWCRRNRAVALLLGAVFSLAILVAVVASAGYVETSRALERESGERARATRERERAEGERERAEAERSRAEANLRLALAAFDEIFAQVDLGEPARFQAGTLSEGEAPVAPPPVASEDTAAILQNLLKFYDRFAQANVEAADLREDLIRAHRRVGEIQRHLGNLAEAQAAYSRARASLVDLPGRTTEVAAVDIEIGQLLLAKGSVEEAALLFRRARESLEDEGGATLDDAGAYQLARSAKYGADADLLSRDVRSARAGYARACQVLEDLLARNPGEADYRFFLACCHRAWTRCEEGRQAQSEHVETSTGILQELCDEFPSVAWYRYELAETYATVEGEFSRDRPGAGRNAARPEEVEARLQKARMIEEELLRSYPAVPLYQASLARNLRKLGHLLVERGKAAEARDVYGQGLALEESLVERFRDVPIYLHDIARTRCRLGELLLEEGKKEEARSMLAASVAAAREYLTTDPDHRPTRAILDQASSLLGEAGGKNR
ncbi:MAG: serine/threonine protein kinase [Planctomycetes bacterium]|nr:serine/threonine protein kinase [Planctomycetota bacterium]